jgi:hypothetical protein
MSADLLPFDRGCALLRGAGDLVAMQARRRERELPMIRQRHDLEEAQARRESTRTWRSPQDTWNRWRSGVTDGPPGPAVA